MSRALKVSSPVIASMILSIIEVCKKKSYIMTLSVAHWDA